MITPVPYGDSEHAVIALLRAGVPTVPPQHIVTIRPEDYRAAAGPLIRVTRVGGVGDDYSHDGARVDIEVWGRDSAEAHDVLQLALAQIRTANYRGGVYAGQVFYKCDVELGPRKSPDALTDEAKWEATVFVRVRPVLSNQ